ncbi:hypothetical protein SELMODRAFT_414483 [Selaginella moellendorffii]|uniref:Epidermal patterning factor-like protein n=1 Tax=Selaginella moellendorffii TaxID=88036 RepID=D8RSX5_SELML|nr:uncharacterized protein LOC9658019 [Selaginella moellendorffii]XP_024535078.1 uncharacterized protein LOC9658019 [Selaginella moellendorffii]EFJ24579.1 hypothetical protein SELMODRAFT_414483 [Selaginella moellendorffii]|eukprot:XP_002974357.1 uncharacterized protein LOC9658019 [Selaginella moellendorffii]
MKRSFWSLEHCCSRRRGGARSLVYLVLAILLASRCLHSSSAGRTQAERLSTGVHESKDAALSLSTKRQQLDQMGDDQQSVDQQSWVADYSPLQLEELRSSSSLVRRSLSGPGSSPPQCTSKCGRCYPCRPVHVPIQPGLVKTAEYYPEAWRCKCGNKLFMP